MFRERVPIKINDTTYEKELPNGKVEIGDKDSVDFKPTAKLKRWGEECSLVLSIPTTEKIAPTIQGEKILWTGRNYGAEFYQATDGFKFNIILPKKPSTNVFPLDFNSDNLKFSYQPPMNERFHDGWSDRFQTDIHATETQVIRVSDGFVLGFCPENVVGSYAAYHASKRDHAVGQTNYKAGKAFHWYKPLIYDKAGHTCWGILDVRQGLRTVTVPQSFLDNAIYPVTIDDFLGYTDKGGSGIASTSFVGTRATAGGDGTVTLISMYLKEYDTAAAVNLGYYNDNADEVGTHVAHGTAAIPDASYDDWFTLNVSGSISNGNIYWIMCQINGLYQYYEYEDAEAGWKQAWTSITFDTWGDNPGVGSYYDGYRTSIYATYTPSGGGSAALTGAATDAITEADVVAGDKEIIITLTDDTWVADDGTFDGQRQNIINGMDSAQSEGTGWDAEVKAKEVVGAVVRTSDTVVTITLTAQAAYDITATETITVTIPGTALVGAEEIEAAPTFDVTHIPPSAGQPTMKRWGGVPYMGINRGVW